MRIFKALRASLLSVAALGTLGSAFIFIGTSQAELSSSPALHITTHTAVEISGRFDNKTSHVEFESRRDTSQHVSVQVRVNNLILDASAELGEDGQKKVVIINGYGKALSPEDKRALIALGGLLERYLDPYRRQQVPPHEDLLARIAGYWGEAPVGFPLTRQETRSPTNP